MPKFEIGWGVRRQGDLDDYPSSPQEQDRTVLEKMETVVMYNPALIEFLVWYRIHIWEPEFPGVPRVLISEG